MELAIETALTSFKSWRKTSFKARAEVLNQVADLMHEDEEALAQLRTLEMGKPFKEARGEVQKSVGGARHYAEHGAAYLATKTLESDASVSYVQHLPLGPVLGILPWHAPF